MSVNVQTRMFYAGISTIDDLTNIVNEHFGYPVYVWLDEPITIRGITLARYTQIFIPRCGSDVIGYAMYPQVTNQPVVAIGRGTNSPNTWFAKEL